MHSLVRWLRHPLFLAFVVSTASAQVGNYPATLSVSGSAEIKVAPDEIVLSVGVESRHAELARACADNDERIARALKFLRASGVADKDIQTDYLSVNPNYDHNHSRVTPINYEVRKSVEIKLRKVAAFEAILTGLLGNGVNYVHGVNFRTSQLRQHRDQARQLAIRAAREKADALGTELGVKRGKVQQISENTWGGSWGWSGGGWGGRGGGFQMQNLNAAANAGGQGESVDGTLALGQIGVSATVNVSFLIE